MQHQSFSLQKADILPLVIMGLLFSFSSLLLFMSYNYMDAGIASTILFVYPVMVAVIMGAFFKEKISAITVFSILLALSGIALLYQGDGSKPLSTIGIVFVLLSSLSYAIYIVGVNRSALKTCRQRNLRFTLSCSGFPFISSAWTFVRNCKLFHPPGFGRTYWH